MEKFDTVLFTYPLVDMIVPFKGQFPVSSGKTYLIDTIVREPGGPANIFICGKRLGLNGLMVGYLGDDDYGKFLIEAYRKEGLDTSMIGVVTGSETRKVLVLIDTEGNHSFLSMAGPIDKPPPDPEPIIRESKSICISGYSLALESTREDCLIHLRIARKLGKLVFFDPGPLVDSIPMDTLRETIAGSTVIIANDEEAEKMTFCGSVEESAYHLSQLTDGMVIVKAGSKGCFVIAGPQQVGVWYEGFKVKVLDTTAAGDTFLSAIIYGYLSDFDVRTMAYFANAVGAAKVKKIGSGSQVPEFDEIITVLEDGAFMVPSSVKDRRNFQNLVLKKDVE